MGWSRDFMSHPVVCSLAWTLLGLPSSAKNTLLQCLSQMLVTEKVVRPSKALLPVLKNSRKVSFRTLTFPLPGCLTCTAQPGLPIKDNGITSSEHSELQEGEH